MAYIDNYASPGNPVVDITGQLVGLLLRFQPRGSNSLSSFPIGNFAGSILPPQSPQSNPCGSVLTTPLSGIFDCYWAQLSAGVSQQIRSQISNGVNVAGYAIYDIQVGLPSKGRLLANVNGTEVFLSYQLSNCLATFVAGNKTEKGLYIVTFDIELLVIVTIPVRPNANDSPITALTSFDVFNVAINAGDYQQQFLGTCAIAFDALSAQPPFLQAAEGQGDVTGSILLAQLPDLLGQISQALGSAQRLGFDVVDAFVGSNVPQTLNIRLTHPIDPAPVFVVPSRLFGFGGTLQTSSPIVAPGGSLTVTATNFQLNLGSNVAVVWSGSTSGAVTEVDVTWAPPAGPTQHISIVPGSPDAITAEPATSYGFGVRSPSGFASGGELDISNLEPNTTYHCTVQVQDFLTETPPSATASFQTGATDQVSLLLKANLYSADLGMVPFDASGGFQTVVQIPNVSPGPYTLEAWQGEGAIGSCSVQVVDPNKASLAFGNPTVGFTIPEATNTIVAYQQFWLYGAGFPAASEVTVSLDSISGYQLGHVSVELDNTFNVSLVWPAAGLGEHLMLAGSNVGSVQASINMIGEPPIG